MARPSKRLEAAPCVVGELRRWSRSATIGVRDRERANIILLRLDGLGVDAVAERLSTTAKRVSTWSGRFARSGLDGLADRPGRGRKTSIAAAKVARVITEATRPPPGRSRWSVNGRRNGTPPQNRADLLICGHEFCSAWGPGRRRSASNRDPTRTPDQIVNSMGSRVW